MRKNLNLHDLHKNRPISAVKGLRVNIWCFLAYDPSPGTMTSPYRIKDCLSTSSLAYQWPLLMWTWNVASADVRVGSPRSEHLYSPSGVISWICSKIMIGWTMCYTLVGFTLTVVNDFRRFLSQFSTNCHEILQALFSIDYPEILAIISGQSRHKWKIVSVKLHEKWLRVDWGIRVIHSPWLMNLLLIWPCLFYYRPIELKLLLYEDSYLDFELHLCEVEQKTKCISITFPVNTKNNCITFVQRWTNVEDAGPTLY